MTSLVNRTAKTHDAQLRLIVAGYEIDSAVLDPKGNLHIVFADDQSLSNEGVAGVAAMFARVPLRDIDRKRGESIIAQLKDSVTRDALMGQIDAALAIASPIVADSARWGNSTFRDAVAQAVRAKNPDRIREVAQQSSEWIANVLRRREQTTKLLAALSAHGE